MDLSETALATEVTQQLELGFLHLSEVYRKHQAYIKAKYHISGLEMEIIQFVMREGPQKMKDIGGYFGVKLSTLTSVIDKLENQNLVKRVNSQQDRRVVLLQVNRKGKKLYDEYQGYLRALAALTHQQLSQESYQGFLDGLNKISEIMNSSISEN